VKLWIIVILLMPVLVLTACSGGNDEPSVTEGDTARGDELFHRGKGTEAPACSTCHRTEEGGSGFALGPTLEDISATAADRVDGQSAEEYIRESILDPEAFVVSGYRVGMFSGYADHFSEQDIADLLAYLLTL
jgi:cytochrome c553